PRDAVRRRASRAASTRPARSQLRVRSSDGPRFGRSYLAPQYRTKCVAQFYQSKTRARLYGSERLPELQCDLAVTQPRVIGKLDDLSLLGGKAFKRRAHQTATFRGHRILLGARGGRADFANRIELILILVFVLAGPQPIYSSGARDRHHPRERSASL